MAHSPDSIPIRLYPDKDLLGRDVGHSVGYVEPRENELNWPSADILVSYDSAHSQIVYSKLSTGEVLKTVDA